MHFLLFISMPLVALVCIVGRRLATKTRPASAGRNIFLKTLVRNKSNTSNNCLTTTGNNRLAWAIQTLLLLVVSLGTAVLASDPAHRQRLRLHYFARQQMWSELLRQAQAFVNDFKYYYDDFVCLDVNRALYHTGQLGDEMFSYPQQPSGLLLLPPQRSRRPSGLLRIFSKKSTGQEKLRVTRVLSDVLYELGHINYAENNCYEFLTRFRRCPWVLKRLALINIIKQQPEAARVYLRRLLNDPYLDNRNWAHNYLEKLKKDPFLSKDEEIRRLRNSIIPNDAFIDNDYLPKLLETDIPNQMAFEYFAAQCLLNGDLSKFADLIQYLDDFDFTTMPRHYQEAILLYCQLSKKDLDLRGRNLDPQIRRRFEKFMHIFNINDKSAAMSALRGEYSDTFYFYYYFKLP